MKEFKKHQACVEKLQKEMEQAYLDSKKITLNRKGVRNTTRGKKRGQHILEAGRLNRILGLDLKEKEVWVEPGVTMEKLVDFTSKQGLVPKVVPEFKGITVGGAIQGGALESSSFKFGQFNDTCTSIELLLGNGKTLWVSKEEHSDLFYGLSGSYGSLAIICSIKVSLVKRPKQVHLEFFRFNSFRRLQHTLKTLLPLPHYDFLEGIGYHANSWILIAGKSVEEKGRHFLKLNKRSPWYYEQVYKLSMHKVDEVEMDLKSYLFRHDQGAFWMGRHLNCWKTLLLYLLQRKPSEEFFLKLLEDLKSKPFALSNPFLRTLLGSKLSSKSLYQALHKMPREWVRQFLMIQDSYIPLNQVEEFVRFAQENLGVFPIWFCPIQAASSSQFLSPHNSQDTHYFVNVGLYGIPQKKESAEELTQKMEEKVQLLGGKKMLYGHNFYSQEHFWNQYDLAQYSQIREKYQANKTLHTLTDKILSEG